MADIDITLATLTSDQFTTAEAELITVIRRAYPTLDLRKGTVLRDWLIRPAAAVYAVNTERMAELQSLISINTILANPNASDSDVDAVLANFGMVRNAGGTASGQVLVKVTESRDYVIAAGTVFATADGLQFTLSTTTTVRASGAGAGEVALQQSLDGSYYYFLLPLTAAAVGTTYNVAQGTALTTDAAIFSYISSEAYTPFTGGSNAETATAAVARLPAAISYRALESRTSIEGKLRSHFGTDLNIVALGIQGYGDDAQLRDKHNPFGIAVGSRVDIYPRTFTTPVVVTLTKTGTKLGANTYGFDIDPGDAPGFYAIRAVAEPATVLAPGFGNDITVLGSYAFTETRSAPAAASTFHDIDPSNIIIESAYTVYQKSTVIVTGVTDTAATHAFKVEVYAAPGLQDIQTYVDSADVRNLEADYIVRCPVICMVRLNATAYYPRTSTLNIKTLTQVLVDYINSRSFVPRLSRSEIAGVMLSNGVSRVDLANGMTLQGIIRGADGTVTTLSGDSLDVDSNKSPTTLMTAGTVVFATETSAIFLEAVAE